MGRCGVALAMAMAVGVPVVSAQTAIDLKAQTRNVDFTSAAATKPNKSGDTLPVTCSVGETFFKTNTSPGQNMYGCVAANTWATLGSAVLPVSTVPGQVLVWTGSAWVARSAAGANVSLTFNNILDGTCMEQVAALPFQWGVGTPVELSVPVQYCDPTKGVCSGLAGVVSSARISATGVATVRMCNFSGAVQSLPAANYTLTQYNDNKTTATIAFPQLLDGTCASQTVTVTGVTTASAVVLGLPATIETGLLVTAAPTGADSVTVTGCNWSGVTLSPAAASYQIGVK